MRPVPHFRCTPARPRSAGFAAAPPSRSQPAALSPHCHHAHGFTCAMVLYIPQLCMSHKGAPATPHCAVGISTRAVGTSLKPITTQCYALHAPPHRTALQLIQLWAKQLFCDCFSSFSLPADGPFHPSLHLLHHSGLGWERFKEFQQTWYIWDYVQVAIETLRVKLVIETLHSHAH